MANDAPHDPGCQVGQAKPCGEPTFGACAAAVVPDANHLYDEPQPGIVLMCVRHFTTPASEWNEDWATRYSAR